ncbi:MAG TPA: hypothetical protein VJT32_08025 [bacterium]|nr:hypothetical protein [bacterium]
MKDAPVTAAPLYPFLKKRGITSEQVEALEIGLFLEKGDGPMAQGAMTLLPASVVLEALEAIDDHPWKDTSAREFREHLQAELKATHIEYWIAGAGQLPLEDDPQEGK